MKAGGSREHLAVFDQRGEKPFRVVRAADGTAEQYSGAISDGLRVEIGGADRIACGEPGEFVAARTVKRSAEFGEIARDFADGNLAVARGLKQRERFESTLTCDDGRPDFINARAESGDDAQAGDDWRAICH